LKWRIFFIRAKRRPRREGGIKVVGNLGNSSVGRPTICGFRPANGTGKVIQTGEKQHQYADFNGAPGRLELGLGVDAGHTTDVGRPSDLESLSTAAVGYRGLSGEVV
jgi:hypothetical protein